MATIERPRKTYGTRKYVQEVALAPDNIDPILANEVDEDLDVIYSAWNQGADTVNIKPGAVTYDRLAPDAQLWSASGTSLVAGGGRAITTTYGAGTGSVIAGAGGLTTRLVVAGALTANHYWNGATSAWARDDATKGGWSFQLDPVGDTLFVQHTTAAGVANSPLFMDSLGNTTLIGRLRKKAFTSGLYGQTAHLVGPGQNIVIVYDNVWFDSGGQTAPWPSQGQLYTPNFYELVMVWGKIEFDANGGLGMQFWLEYSPDNTTWASLATFVEQAAKTINIMALFPAPAAQHLRTRILNATGGLVTIYSREFVMCGLGTWA